MQVSTTSIRLLTNVIIWNIPAFDGTSLNKQKVYLFLTSSESTNPEILRHL